MSLLPRWSAFAAVGVLVFLFAASPVRACPFCGMQGQTFTKEASDAEFVVYGLLTNPKLHPEGGGTTDLIIEPNGIIKSHKFIEGKKSILINKYIGVDEQKKLKYVVFCGFFRGEVDAYRGIPVKEEFVEYLKGALAVKDKDVTTRLRYFFKYLGSSDLEISVDAFKEFGNTDGKAVMAMAEQVRQNEKDRAAMAAQLTTWMKDPDTPDYRFGLYGYLLGLVGTEDDADVLHDVLNDEKRYLITGVDGMLAGYIKLKPKEGYQFLCDILANPKLEITRRYAALRTVKFFWTDRPDVLKHEQILKAVRPMLDQNDAADLIIEQLRKWKQWQWVDEILHLYNRPSHDINIVKRAILRYALSCPDPKAKAFIEVQRKVNKQRVEDVEELLKLEEG